MTGIAITTLWPSATKPENTVILPLQPNQCPWHQDYREWVLKGTHKRAWGYGFGRESFPQQSWGDTFTSFSAGHIHSVLGKVTFSHRMWPVMCNFHTSVFTATLEGSWDSYHRLSFDSELLLSLTGQLSDIITDILVKPVKQPLGISYSTVKLFCLIIFILFRLWGMNSEVFSKNLWN